eukprot:2248561-Rhodomonas_salina.1
MSSKRRSGDRLLGYKCAGKGNVLNPLRVTSCCWSDCEHPAAGQHPPGVAGQVIDSELSRKQGLNVAGGWQDSAR